MERGDTLEWDHAESTSSVDAAACLRLTEFDVVRGFTGADGGTTWKPCIQKEQRAGGRTGGGNRQPTDGKIATGSTTMTRRNMILFHRSSVWYICVDMMKRSEDGLADKSAA